MLERRVGGGYFGGSGRVGIGGKGQEFALES